MEALDVATTRLITFDKNVHVRSINKTSNGTSPAAPKTFEPVTSNGASDFEL